MSSLALLASSAATAVQPYPVQDILTAFGEVCFAEEARSYEPLKNVPVWKRLAVEKGWDELAEPPPSGRRRGGNTELRAYNWAKALNWDLLSSMGDGEAVMTSDALYHKQVAGRDIYLSILGIDTGNTLAECRLRDPLGDGIAKLPIRKAEIEQWIGKPVTSSKGASKGWFGGRVYSWDDKYPLNSVRVHFGFEHKSLGDRNPKYDPYAQYGMTLVRSDYPLIIVT